VPSTRALIFANAVSRAVAKSSPNGEKAAVISRSESVERNELGRLDHSVPNLLRRLHAFIQRIDDATNTR
jgi:hypothetical protein